MEKVNQAKTIMILRPSILKPYVFHKDKLSSSSLRKKSGINDIFKMGDQSLC